MWRQSYRQLDIRYTSILQHTYAQWETHIYPQPHTEHDINFHLQEAQHWQRLSSSLLHPAQTPPGEDRTWPGSQGEQPVGTAF